MPKEPVLSQRLCNEPLVTGFIPGSELENSTGCYFGIGLSNKDGLTEYLPFDVLGLVLAAELVRRRAELDKSTVLIADEHAATNSSDSPAISRISNDRRGFLYRIFERFDFYNFDVVLGSELFTNSSHARVAGRVDGNRYERLQIADMEFFQATNNGIKIGWKHGMMEYDERRFDALHSELFGSVTSFVYTEPGRALDGTAMPPYLCTTKPRLLFLEKEDINYKVDHMPRKVRAYFIRLLDLYDKLVCGHSGNGRNAPDKLKRRLREVYSTVYGTI